MKLSIITYATLLFILCSPVNASDCSSQIAVSRLFAEDQSDRQKPSIDWKVQTQKDGRRVDAVRRQLEMGCLETSADYYHAGMIMQHGQSVREIKLAFQLATISSYLDGKKYSAKWLTAATFDRIMMMTNQPQWYGTQFTGNPGNYVLYPVAPDLVSDEERKELGVPTLQEMQKMVDDMNSSAKKNVH